MGHKGIIVGGILLGIIILGMFIFVYLEKTKITNDTVDEPPQTTIDEVLYPDIVRIEAKHFYTDGLHTLVGDIPFPTPCDLLNWDTMIAESYPEQVTVNFTVTNYADTCAQVITPQRFKVEFTASADAQIKARFEDRPVELNLIPASAGENPDDFDLFIKG